MNELRLRDTLEDKPLLELPVVFKGDSSECRRYAISNDYHWVSRPQMLFGGYFANDAGNCLLPS